MNYSKILTVAAAGALLAPAAASADATISGVAVQKASAQSQKGFTEIDTLKSGGKTIGGIALSGSYNAKSKSVSFDVSVALDGGMIYARFTNIADQKSYTGKITGGAGKYAGASGTVDATDMGKKKTGVVIHVK